MATDVTATATATATAAAHPDAALLAAYERWLAGHRGYKADPSDEEEDLQSYHAAIDDAEKEIEGLPARTAAGLLVKLRIAFHGYALDAYVDEEAFIARGEVSDATLAQDYRARMFWSAIQDVERIAASAPAALISPGVCRIVPAGVVERQKAELEELRAENARLGAGLPASAAAGAA